jgi:hypothetical protein
VSDFFLIFFFEGDLFFEEVFFWPLPLSVLKFDFIEGKRSILKLDSIFIEENFLKKNIREILSTRYFVPHLGEPERGEHRRGDRRGDRRI